MVHHPSFLLHKNEFNFGFLPPRFTAELTKFAPHYGTMTKFYNTQVHTAMYTGTNGIVMRYFTNTSAHGQTLAHGHKPTRAHRTRAYTNEGTPRVGVGGACIVGQ